MAWSHNWEWGPQNIYAFEGGQGMKIVNMTENLHIYACKYHNNEPKVGGFIKRIERIRSIEKYIALKKKKRLNMLNCWQLP